ncbi:MAG: hypothetical protein QOJ50_1514 [Cryptosporangiaceae bacterium]|jgi:hypothetical protein|nr:hypothetical protein [Cryptosporangiaceae bacterium]
MFTLFTSGARLADSFHAGVVGPLLAARLPGLRYSAGRLGAGSDVLGLDDPVSRDHDWGLRLAVLLDECDAAAVPAVLRVLGELGGSFGGHPVRFALTTDPEPRHRVQVATARDFAAGLLGPDPLGPLGAVDWLVLTGQSILEVTAGPVFSDTATDLMRIRERLRSYPPQVELYVLASAWESLGQALPLAGRAAGRGGRTQWRILASGLCATLTHLAFVLRGAWPPYPKWTEALFARIPGAADLADPLAALASAPDWPAAERAFAAAASILLGWQRDRGLPAPAHPVIPFFGRAYLGVEPAIAAGLRALVTDPEVLALPPGVGSLEQWTGHTAVLSSPGRRAALAAAYRTWSAP